MSYDIYICGDCWGPIWFPFRKLMHVGTGWYCWGHQQRGGEEGRQPTDPVGEFIKKTNPQLLQELVAEACRRYRMWAPKDRESQLIPFLQRQLRAGRSDVLHNFCKHLTKQPPERAGAVVREIMATPEWTRFAKRALTRKRLPARRQKAAEAERAVRARFSRPAEPLRQSTPVISRSRLRKSPGLGKKTNPLAIDTVPLPEKPKQRSARTRQ
jgi:hypothetical protein